MDVNQEKAQGASGGKRARQVLLREGRRQEEPHEVSVKFQLKSLAIDRPPVRTPRRDSGKAPPALAESPPTE